MESDAPGFILTIVAFLAGFSLLVFIHEMGHFLVARAFGVKVDAFSIGFGRELFGWTDRKGTRWRISMLPLGGYVKFFGDQSAASDPSRAAADMPAQDRAVCLHFKPVWQRALVVAAGPAINLLAGALVFAGFYLFYGINVAEPVVAKVMPESAAAEAGLSEGDRILRIDGKAVDSFSDISPIVRLYPGREVSLTIKRDARTMTITPTLGTQYMEDRWGNRYPYGVLGVQSGPASNQPVGPIRAVGEGVEQTGVMIRSIFTTLGQLVMGLRSVDEVGGPLRIATMTGEAAAKGPETFIWFLALISINLGVINLLPIPVLDGGHLMFYAIEALKGSPLSAKAQEAGFVAGFALVLMFMVLVTLNDLKSMAL
ncbi:RIP metalloprotease RseP [Yunchengibacter salinarum]|uniref:RIP metalloprotease RseP n=1 Tax=Yunchengibacter salinarum TaxID=3133399 RepID=UPI0035B5818A